jgi:beta-aspartyl-dipeptidase (metallo-type)
VRVFTPENVGTGDILLAGNIIAAMGCELEPLFRLVRETDIPISQLLPTHVTRNRDLFSQALQFLEAGGNTDITVYPDISPPPPLSLTETLPIISERHKSLKGVTLSSDANGSLPKFDDQGRFIGMGVGQIDVLRQSIRRLVMEEGVAAESMSGRSPAGS